MTKIFVVFLKAEHDFYREKWQKEKNRSRISSHHFEMMTHNIVRVSFAIRVRGNILSLFIAYFSAFYSFEWWEEDKWAPRLRTQSGSRLCWSARILACPIQSWQVVPTLRCSVKNPCLAESFGALSRRPLVPFWLREWERKRVSQVHLGLLSHRLLQRLAF